MRLPQLLDAAGRCAGLLHPIRLSLEQTMQGVHRAAMTLLPRETPAIGALLRLFDGVGGFAGVFRVCGVSRAFGAEALCEVRLEHALALLGDQVIFGPRSTAKILGVPEQPGLTASVADTLRYLIANNQMEGVRWRLGDCDFTDAYAFSYDDENLLAAVLRTMAVIQAPWDFFFDFDTTPWTLHIRRLSDAPDCVLRPGRSLLSLTAETVREDFFTRVYPVGADDLMLPGDRNIDADTMGELGYRCAIRDFPHVRDAQELRAVATAWLESRKRPVTAIRAEALDRSALTGEPLDHPRCGGVCQIALPADGTVITQRVVALSAPDLTRDPQRLCLTMATRDASAVRAVLTRV